MRFRLALSAALPLMLAAPSAFAQDLATTAIASGDYATAEKVLQAKLKKQPGATALLLNLAAVYVGTGREAQARSLYSQVLSQPDVLMDVSETRSLGSHAVAMNGLKRLQASQLSAR